MENLIYSLRHPVDFYRWLRGLMEDEQKYCTVTINKPLMRIKGKLQRPKPNFKYIAFFGIPYANPPIKDKRFQPPEPLTQQWYCRTPRLWNACTRKTKRCLQPDNRARDSYAGSEDCLYLDVYIPSRPKINGRLSPVLVYIHGGGFEAGHCDCVQPDFLVGKEKCILVTLHYRLGSFGFLNMRSANCRGNVGLKDQVMALRWVRDNIQPFGGNPENVTIYGHSAGASAVNLHMISPLSKGLFHQAIVQSGGIYCPWGYGGHAREVNHLFKKRSKNRNNELRHVLVECFKNLPAFEFMKYSETIRNDIIMMEPKRMTVFLKPSVECGASEDAFLPDTVENLMSTAEPVPTIAGITKQEGYMFYRTGKTTADTVNTVTNDYEFFDFIKQNFQWTTESVWEHFDALRSTYFPGIESLREEEIKQHFATFVTDIYFRRFYDNFNFGHLLSFDEEDPPLYVYQFDYFTGVPISPPMIELVDGFRQPIIQITEAEHGDDMMCILEPERVFRSLNRLPPENRQQIRDQVSDVIENLCRLWATFCRTGIPRGLPGSVKWRPHTERDPCYLHIAEELTLRTERLFESRWGKLNSFCTRARLVPSQTSTPPAAPSSGDEVDEPMVLLIDLEPGNESL